MAPWEIKTYSKKFSGQVFKLGGGAVCFYRSIILKAANQGEIHSRNYGVRHPGHPRIFVAKCGPSWQSPDFFGNVQPVWHVLV